MLEICFRQIMNSVNKKSETSKDLRLTLFEIPIYIQLHSMRFII